MRVLIVPGSRFERFEDAFEFAIFAFQAETCAPIFDYRGEQTRDPRRSFLQESLHDSAAEIGGRGMRPQPFQLRRDFRKAGGHSAPRFALFRFEAACIRDQSTSRPSRAAASDFFFSAAVASGSRKRATTAAGTHQASGCAAFFPFTRAGCAFQNFSQSSATRSSSYWETPNRGIPCCRRRLVPDPAGSEAERSPRRSRGPHSNSCFTKASTSSSVSRSR